MKHQRDPIQELTRKLKLKDNQIAKWTAAAQQCDDSTDAGRCTKNWCLGSLRWVTQEKERIEAELRRLKE